MFYLLCALLTAFPLYTTHPPHALSVHHCAAPLRCFDIFSPYLRFDGDMECAGNNLNPEEITDIVGDRSQQQILYETHWAGLGDNLVASTREALQEGIREYFAHSDPSKYFRAFRYHRDQPNVRVSVFGPRARE